MSNTKTSPYTEEEIAQHRATWIEALRSGEYKQGVNSLCRMGMDGDPRFCCLGVAADLAGVEVMDDFTIPGSNRAYKSTAAAMSGDSFDFEEVSVLPSGAAEWLGLNDRQPTLAGEGYPLPRTYGDDTVMERSLIALNDAGVPFEVIADLIESQGLK